MSFLSYADALLRRTDEILNSMWHEQDNGGDEGEFIPPPPPTPPSLTGVKVGPPPPSDVSTLLEHPRSANISHFTHASSDSQSIHGLVTRTAMKDTGSESNVSLMTQTMTGTDINTPVHHHNLFKPPLASKTTNNHNDKSNSNQNHNNNQSKDNESMSSVSIVPSEAASSMVSHSSFTSVSGRLSQYPLPSYPTYPKDPLVEPPSMMVQPLRVRSNAKLRQVTIFTEQHALKIRGKSDAVKVGKVFQWMMSALKDETDSLIAFHFCETLNLLENVSACLVTVKLMKFWKHYVYERDESLTVMAMALSCLEHSMGTKTGLEMSSKERGYIAVLQCYLCHCSLLDEVVSLKDWYSKLFKDFCAFSVLNSAVMKLWSLRDYRLGVAPDDVVRKSKLLTRPEPSLTHMSIDH